MFVPDFLLSPHSRALCSFSLYLLLSDIYLLCMSEIYTCSNYVMPTTHLFSSYLLICICSQILLLQLLILTLEICWKHRMSDASQPFSYQDVQKKWILLRICTLFHSFFQWILFKHLLKISACLPGTLAPSRYSNIHNKSQLACNFILGSETELFFKGTRLSFMSVCLFYTLDLPLKPGLGTR